MSYQREIERKYLVVGDGWKKFASASMPICQGIISQNACSIVRVRIQGTQGMLNVKFVREAWHSRDEFDYKIPLAEAKKMLELSAVEKIEKTRWPVMHNGCFWEIDVFNGDNDGLIIAEIELESIDQVVDIPEWIGAEVTDDKRYYNINLAKNPHAKWSD